MRISGGRWRGGLGKGEVRANLLRDTRIPGCIVVVDKENAVDRQGPS